MHAKIYFPNVIVLLLLLLTTTGNAAEQNSVVREYTIDHPLIYEDIWDLPPYTFLNKDGEPNGFNIDLIKTIMRKLNIPYIIRLKPTATAYNDLKEGRSDLMLGMYTDYHSRFGRYGRSVVGLFTHGVARPKYENTEIDGIESLKDNKVVVQRNSFSHHYMTENGMENNTLPFDDINDAILRVGSRDSGQILWNTLSLKYILNRYSLDNLHITPINMPNGEYRFMSGDTRLLELMDSVYEAMTVNEELQPIRNKWFYPEVRPSGIPKYVWYIVGVLALIILLLVISNRIYHIRENKVNRMNGNLSRRLQLYLQAGKIQIWAFDTERNRFIAFTPEGEQKEEYTELGFSVFFNHEDYKMLCAALYDVRDGRTEKKTVLARCHRPTTPDREQYFNITISVLNRKYGKPALILGTQQNITEERQKHIETNNLMLKFHTVFNTVKVDMALYDSDGILIDLNDKACETLGDKQTLINRKISIKNVLPNVDIDMQKPEMVYASSIIRHPADGNRDEGKDKSIMPENVKYYELMVLPIFHENRLVGFFATGRDVTELAVNMKKEREKTRLIRTRAQRQYEYVKSINYALEISHIWLVNYYPDTRMLELTYDLQKPIMKLSQLRCVQMVDDSERRRVVKLIGNMDKRITDKFNIKVRTIFSDDKTRDLYLQLSGVPIYDSNGRIDHYFGLCRNVSKLEETEIRLKLEMQKARDAESVKNAFMKNMSYEIRTPLNAVIGFAELFDMEHSPEDEPVFMSEIRKNSNILLKLVNDILLLSRIDANMIELNNTEVDFAEIFGAHCMIGWNPELSSGVKTIIENPYEHLQIDIDATQLGKVIEIMTANASHFTTQGMIRGRYEYYHDELIISIEDTGEGIDETVQKSMFDRMDIYEDIDHCCVRLGLMICKKLVEKMGGHLDLESEPGKGTTVWITIPCTATTIKKKNILI